ncbi:hypothetical protein PENTCL1PPCAC_24994, partial [Pristionchus entomophagus]
DSFLNKYLSVTNLEAHYKHFSQACTIKVTSGESVDDWKEGTTVPRRYRISSDGRDYRSIGAHLPTRATVQSCWQSGQRLFCFTHCDMQQLWKECEHSPHTTTHSAEPAAAAADEEEEEEGMETGGGGGEAVARAAVLALCGAAGVGSLSGPRVASA